MRAKFARLVVVFCAAAAGCRPIGMTVPATATPTAGCPITAAPVPAFVPPKPYPAQLPAGYEGEFWYGTRGLWTILSDAGVWTSLPTEGGGYGQKIFYWSESYNGQDELKPALNVTGTRLDADAGPMIASGATDANWELGPAMLVGVVMPTEGCWRITAAYRGTKLSFVVEVEP